MQALFLDIEEFAPVDISVLIQGETGTGKELVASAVQGLSARKERPYEVVNCATLTRELLGSELFGQAQRHFPLEFRALHCNFAALRHDGPS
jgi:DNA-binding NtrC family response regulator